MIKIQDFSLKTGVSKRMLRYLEEQGLLVPHRGENEYRFYDQQHLEEVRWIQFWQKLGFSLNQTKVLKSLDSQKVEEQLELLLAQKKEEVSLQARQLQTIRTLIRKLKNESADLRKEFAQMSTWNSGEREEFWSRIAEPGRIVYGKFPEIERLSNSILEQLVQKSFRCEVQSCDLMKAGEAIAEMRSSEAIIWDRKTDYSYIFAAFPEDLHHHHEVEKLEDILHHALQEGLDEVFYGSPLDPAARVFQASDTLQFIAPREIVFRLTFVFPEEKGLFYIVIPFQFVHGLRNGGSVELSMLNRSLQQSLIQLSEEQIIEKTKSISNDQYLLTALLAEAKTRNIDP